MPKIFNPADIVKIGVIAFVVIYFTSKTLRKAGLDEYAI